MAKLLCGVISQALLQRLLQGFFICCVLFKYHFHTHKPITTLTFQKKASLPTFLDVSLLLERQKSSKGSQMCKSKTLKNLTVVVITAYGVKLNIAFGKQNSSPTSPDEDALP